MNDLIIILGLFIMLSSSTVRQYCLKDTFFYNWYGSIFRLGLWIIIASGLLKWIQ